MTAGTDAETRYVAERMARLLLDEALSPVARSLTVEDGWRSEWLSRDGDDDFVLWTHKPNGAPYVSVGTTMRAMRPKDARIWEVLVEVISDFELSFWFTEGARPMIQLSSRLPVMALAAEAIGFQIGVFREVRAELSRVLTEEGL
ncbi:MAG: hypothetical protein KDB53_17520 [Planctomycetes bacterium]|nr:hypothetical protein [Planctomycetota bacterium]